MEDLAKGQSCPDVPPEEREAMEINKLIRMLRWTGTYEDADHVQIFDELCHRDPLDALLARHIRRHSLLEDNPTSG